MKYGLILLFLFHSIAHSCALPPIETEEAEEENSLGLSFTARAGYSNHYKEYFGAGLVLLTDTNPGCFGEEQRGIAASVSFYEDHKIYDIGYINRASVFAGFEVGTSYDDAESEKNRFGVYIGGTFMSLNSRLRYLASSGDNSEFSLEMGVKF